MCSWISPTNMIQLAGRGGSGAALFDMRSDRNQSETDEFRRAQPILRTPTATRLM